VDLQLRPGMADDQSRRRLSKSAREHIDSENFEQAEIALRTLLDEIDPDDHISRWIELIALAGTLNMLDRADEGTEVYRQVLAEAQQMFPQAPQLDVSRYMLGNQYLLFGDPRDALKTVNPIPDGSGHVQCLMHAVAAQALWKLERRDEACASAKSAMVACPTDDRRAQLSEELSDILGS
jgi:hypothetical protein